MKARIRQCWSLLLTSLLTLAAYAAPVSDPGKLRLVLVLSRHGVRSPTTELAHLNAYARDAWPAWQVPPGYLTPHGRELMTIMGRWYRAYYAQAGWLPANGCMGSSVYAIADDEERIKDSARGLLEGFDPQCAVPISTAPKSGANALFAHDFTDASVAFRTEAQAAVLGRIGGDPTRMAAANAGLIDALEGVLMGCAPGQCDPAKAPGKKWLMAQPAKVAVGQGGSLLKIESPLHQASSLAEDLYLEYVQGMAMPKVAWGRATAQQLGQLLALHSIYVDTSLRTPVIARAYAAELARRILATLEQAVQSKPRADALGPDKTKIVFLLGHDTNIETLAGLLDLHWLLPEQPADPVSAGGALVFELRQDPGSGRSDVRAYYVSQSMEQMRHGTKLDLAHPPLIAPIFIPACSEATAGYDCPLPRFAARVAQALHGESLANP